MVEVDVMKMVKRQMKSQQISAQRLGRLLNISYTGAWQMMKSDSIRVNRLLELSEVLQYNFFREVSLQLPYAAPSDGDPNAPLLAENTALKAQIRDLELQLKTLKEAIGLLRL